MPLHTAAPPIAPATPSDGPTASFGFQEVPAQEKAGMVRGVFDAVARRYDIMNDLMSMGRHRAWKRWMVQVLSPRPGECVLDLAGGTGDVAQRIHAACPQAQITVADINAAMVAEGRARACDAGLPQAFRWTVADAEALPFADRSVHAVTMAFGIRNVTHMDQALREAHRVLRPGGRFVCLEFSPVHTPGLQRLYDAYSFHVIPRVGQLVTGDGGPYQYLVESIRRFPTAEDFAGRIERAGFARVSFLRRDGGVVALHRGWKV